MEGRAMEGRDMDRIGRGRSGPTDVDYCHTLSVIGHGGQTEISGEQMEDAHASNSLSLLTRFQQLRGALQGGAVQGGAVQGGAVQGGALQDEALQGGSVQGGAVQGGFVQREPSFFDSVQTERMQTDTHPTGKERAPEDKGGGAHGAPDDAEQRAIGEVQG